MCAIARVVAYFLSVNLLHIYVHCLFSLCEAPTFSFEGIKNFLTRLPPNSGLTERCLITKPETKNVSNGDTQAVGARARCYMTSRTQRRESSVSDVTRRPWSKERVNVWEVMGQHTSRE